MTDRTNHADAWDDADAAPAIGTSNATVPTAAIVPYAMPADVVPAGLGERLVAWFIDAAVLLGVRLVVLVLLGFAMQAAEKAEVNSETIELVGGLSVIALLYLVGWPYYAVLEASRRRATLGKLAMGIRVDDIDGGPATFTQTSFRYFLRVVSALPLGIGFLMALVGKRRQTLHDVAANCVVVTGSVPQGG